MAVLEPGVYSTPCERGNVGIRHTGWSIESRCKEYTRHVRLYQPEKSAVVRCYVEWGHQIKFKDTEVSAKAAVCLGLDN